MEGRGYDRQRREYASARAADADSSAANGGTCATVCPIAVIVAMLIETMALLGTRASKQAVVAA